MRSMSSIWMPLNKGDYQKAVEQENLGKTLVEVFYPNRTIMPVKSLPAAVLCTRQYP